MKSSQALRCSTKYIAIFLALSSYSLASQALDYYWAVVYGHYSTAKGSSPTEACQKAIDGLNTPRYSGVTLKDVVRHDTQPTTFYCYWCQYSSCNLPRMSANRSGNACPEGKIYNETTGECANDQDKGPPSFCPSSYSGNPINFSVGNKFQLDSDYQLNGNAVLVFSRSYNSMDGLWRHNYSTYLRFGGTQYVSVVMAHGRESLFAISGTLVNPTSVDLGLLSKTDTGWQYVSTDNQHFTFDSIGKLVRWSNAYGAVYQLTYSGNQVTVTDLLGNSLTYTESAEHQPLTLSAPGVEITYEYNANKRLTSFTRTLSGQATQRQFHYEDGRNNALLTGITDERGVRYATWSYDDRGRAISSEHTDGADRVVVAYNSDGTVSVTNELGKVTKYSFQNIKGVKRITSIQGEPSANCPNSNSSFTYDSRGLLKTKTDNKGFLTTYDYNDRGLEVSRTEGAGTAQARTITTAWHPSLFLPLVVTESDRIIRYQYDEQGRQLSRTVETR